MIVFHQEPLTKCALSANFLTLGRTRGGGEGTRWVPPPRVFLSFLLEDKTLASDVFGSSSFISRAHFESSSVIVSFYGYEILRHKFGVDKPCL